MKEYIVKTNNYREQSEVVSWAKGEGGIVNGIVDAMFT